MAFRATLCLLCLTAGVALALRQAPATAEEPSPAGRALGGVPVARSNNYDLDHFRRMPERARGAVAVARSVSHRTFASGVLVARDLVLTCRHVTHVQNGSVRRREPDDLEVRIASDDGEVRAFPVLAFALTSETHDCCVLEIGPDADGRFPESDRVRKVSPARVALDEPLFVAHHPNGGPLVIGGDARVLFPFEATGGELDAITQRLRLEAATPERARDLVTALRASYRPTGRGTWRNLSVRWARQPVLGANCPTFAGSSGAPVFDKRTLALVGILFAGVDETEARIPSTWEHHEAVLPAAAILEDFAGSSDPRIRRLACTRN